DEPAIVLAINEGRAVADRDVGELLQGDVRTRRSSHQDVANRDGIVAILALEPDDEVELFLLLDDLSRRVAADRGLDQSIEVVDVDAVARGLVAIDLDGQARLAELLDQRHVVNAPDMLQDALDRLALGLERVQVGAEYLHGERALE